VAVTVTFIMSLISTVAMMALQVQRDNAESADLFVALYFYQSLLLCALNMYYLLRFMTLGSAITAKMNAAGILLVESVNITVRLGQLQTADQFAAGNAAELAHIAQERSELVQTNNVLKLAAKLLKEVESPKKVSGLSMSPLLYQITRIVVLSALSTVISDSLGFKLKLFKLNKAI